MGSPATLDPRAFAAWLRRFARTTPGVVAIIAIAVATGCVIAGVVCGARLNGRIARSHVVLDRSEPLAYSAQNLYAALADATAGATNVDTGAAMADISAQLAAYAGLVESARANNRQGFAIGSGYLREASSLMRTALLPGAERIYVDNLATVDEDQRAIDSTPTVALVLLMVVLVVIGVGSAILIHQDALLHDVRFIVGIKMHTQGMTIEQAQDMFAEQAYQPDPVAESEPKRGTSDATYGY